MRRHFHCRFKKKFFTQEGAEVARRFRASRKASWNKVAAYQCRVCDFWHLGHRDLPDQNRIRFERAARKADSEPTAI